MTGVPVNFGPVVTNGSFRLTYGGAVWRLVPLPGSSAFNVKLRLNQLNAAGRKVAAITTVGEDPNAAGTAVNFRQDGDAVTFEAEPNVFGYRISVGN
jgi:hypothetical protein